MPDPEGSRAKKALYEKLELLRRGKWIILIVFTLVMAGTAAYTFSLAPVYEAYTLVMIDPRPTKVTSESNIALDLLGSEGLNNRNVANQALIIQQSLTIAERAARRLMVMEHMPGTYEPLHLLLNVPARDSVSIHNVALHLQRNVVKVTPQQEGVDALWIKATSTSAPEAALIANVFTNEYVDRTRETSRQHLTASRTFLEDQIAKLHAQLATTEDSIRTYRIEKSAVNLDEETKFTITQIAQLEAALDEVRIERRMHEASKESLERELSQIQPRLAQRVASGVEKEIEQTQAEVAKLELYMEQILIQNPSLRDKVDQNKDLSDTRRKIDELKARVQRLSEQYVSEMMAVGGIDPTSKVSGMRYVAQLNEQLADERIMLSGLAAKEEALEQRLGVYSANLSSIPTQATVLARLERTRQSAERLYISLIAKLQEAQVAEESELGFARIIRPALEPSYPIRPRRLLNLFLGGILGLVFGVGAAALRHRVDTRVYTPDVLRGREYQLLSVVPDMRPMIRNDFQREQKVLTNGREVSTTLAALLNPFSPAAEAYQRLFMRLQRSTPTGMPQTVVITSPEPEAGKSTTVINLAITAARSGIRTLMIDADLRKPALCKYLELSPRPDFDKMLRNEALTWDPPVFATGISDLYAIASDTPSDTSPSILLNSDRMDKLLEHFRQHFELIIFDTPPVLLVTDALILAAKCDATILMASAGNTSSEALAQSMDDLRDIGATVIGTVLNQFDVTHIYGYQSTYGYSAYGYGDKKGPAKLKKG